MNLLGQSINDKLEYELLYIKYKQRAKVFSLILIFACAVDLFAAFIDLIYSIVFNQWGWERIWTILGILLRILVALVFIEYRWHGDYSEDFAKGRKGVYPVWLGKIEIVITCTNWLFSFSLPSFIIFYIETGKWTLLIYSITCSLMLLILPFIFYYLVQWLRIFRWTWEELQLPVQRRKKLYKERKRLYKQQSKQKAANDYNVVHKKAVKNVKSIKMQANKKPLKSQESRRAELENLKKLYEDGLIDEEDYKRAREKALNIK